MSHPHSFRNPTAVGDTGFATRAQDASPQDATPSPTTPPKPAGEQPQHHGHGHGWLMWLMCLPMLLIVGYLLLTGAVGGGAIIYALGCLVMMGVMMRLMNHGTGDGTGHGPRT